MQRETRSVFGGHAAPEPDRGASAAPGRRLLLAAVFVVGISAAAHAATGWDPRDQPYLSTIVNQALETERTKVEIPWSNPETGHRGIIVIDRTWYRDPQSPCRDYRWTLESSGHAVETISGTGCRIGPAVWRLDEGAAGGGLSIPGPAAPLPVPRSSPPAPTPAVTTPPPLPDPPPTPQAAPPAPTKATKSARKRSTPASKPAASASTASEPATLPGYTMPSRTAM